MIRSRGFERAFPRRQSVSRRYLLDAVGFPKHSFCPEALDSKPAPGEWDFAHDVLRNPSAETLAAALEASAAEANARHRVRLVHPLRCGPVLEHRHGIMEDNGDPADPGGLDSGPKSAVGVAWCTLGGVKYVHSWGRRAIMAGPAHWFAFFPEPTDREGLHACWALTFPLRFKKLRTRLLERSRLTLERLGPPADGKGLKLNLERAFLRAYVPGKGAIFSDDYARPKCVEVVLRNPLTGARHHVSVPPRFGNPRSRTFQRLGTSAARLRAAMAWIEYIRGPGKPIPPWARKPEPGQAASVKLSHKAVFEQIVALDLLRNGVCTRCGYRGGLFVVRGRYATLCPRCTHLRINIADLQEGGLPEDIARLRDEVIQEVLLQDRLRAEAYPVDRRHVWSCDRCHSRMYRFEVRLVPSEGGSGKGHHRVCYACSLIYRAEGKLGSLRSQQESAMGYPGDPKGYSPSGGS